MEARILEQKQGHRSRGRAWDMRAEARTAEVKREQLYRHRCQDTDRDRDGN